MPGRNYRRQDGCWNCRLCFIKTDWDDCPEYYCTLGAPPRPLCGSAGMRETIYQLPDPENIAAHDAWERWSEPRRTDWTGTCDNWEAKPLEAASQI